MNEISIWEKKKKGSLLITVGSYRMVQILLYKYNN